MISLYVWTISLYLLMSCRISNLPDFDEIPLYTFLLYMIIGSYRSSILYYKYAINNTNLCVSRSRSLSWYQRFWSYFQVDNSSNLWTTMSGLIRPNWCICDLCGSVHLRSTADLCGSVTFCNNSVPIDFFSLKICVHLQSVDLPSYSAYLTCC